MDKLNKNQRLSSAQKNAKNKAWYKEQIDSLEKGYMTIYSENKEGDIEEWRRMKVNYDLFNNRLNLEDFEYVCKPYGAEAGELPAKMNNKDISSSKIKVLLGMEMKRPFTWKVIATNPEATTRTEQEEFNKIKEYVVSEIMKPIQEEEQIEMEQQIKGRDLKEEEIAQIKQQMESQIKARTPEEVKKYMIREYQDPAEVLANQLLNYLIEKVEFKRKTNEGFKHSHLSSKEIFHIGIYNGEPELWVINPLRFNYGKSPDDIFIEDGEWATCEYRMTPSKVISLFGNELKESEIDEIYEKYGTYTEQEFEWSYSEEKFEEDLNTVKVLHCVWKSLRKIKFLTYNDEEGNLQETVVSEEYTLNPDQGDVGLEISWIPEVYEGWKIGDNIYVRMQPIQGQFKDLDNLYYSKLPYYGAVVDNINSKPTCLMDRLKVYQYYYNIVMYRIELLLASDKGKKLMMNINAVPDGMGLDLEKWMYFLESSPVVFFNPNEEGTSYQDANTVGKYIDMSLASDIDKYINLAMFIRKQAGESTGITPNVEGQIGSNEAVTNTRQNLMQSSHILEPYFELHNLVKKNLLQGLIELAKIAYSKSKKKKLIYVLDDLSKKMLDLDIDLLENNTYGLFVSNSTKSQEIKGTIEQLAHAAMQNQKAELSDILAILRQDNIVEAEETLRAAEEKREELQAQQQQQQLQQQQQMEEKEREFELKKHEMEKEKILLKEEERRKTEIIKNSLIAASFNPDQDNDNDGVNDFVELARNGLNEKIQQQKISLEKDKLEHQKEKEKEELKLKKEELKMKKSDKKTSK